ncbi:MAG: tetratricopeptide repeat protein [Ferruginibacter sp.]
MIPAKKLLNLFATVYYQEALAGSDMFEVTRLIEPLRIKCREEKDVMLIWDMVDNVVATNIGKPLLNCIIRFRVKFTDAILEELADKVDAAFLESEEAAWLNVKSAYLNLFRKWRTAFALKFIQKVAGKFSAKKTAVDEIIQITTLMVHRRWVESYDFIVSNATGHYPDKGMRAHLWAVASAIQQYYVGDKIRAQQNIQEGLLLCPGAVYVKDMIAAYELEDNKVDSARKKYEDMVREDSNSVSGLNGIGNCAKKDSELSTAEEWYNKAIDAAPGSLGGYQNKISLYCFNLQFYEQKKDLIPGIVAIQQIIEPDSSYDIYIDSGYACQLINDYQQAEKWFQEAIQLNPERVEGHIVCGHLYLQQLPPEKEKIQTDPLFARVENSFTRAITLGPKCFDGYWGLSIFYQKLLDYGKAIYWLEQAYPLCPMFNELSNIELGKLYEKENDWDKASLHFLRALEINHTSQDAIENAEGFAERLAVYDSGKSAGADRMVSFYNHILALKKPEWEERYYDLLISSIKKFNSEEAGLFEIAKEAKRKFPGNGTFQTIVNELLFVQKFGKKISQLIPVPEAIAIECHSSVCRMFLVEGKNEFRPEFLAKIGKFRTAFHNKFGIVVPPLKFRQYDWISKDYDFYTIFDEVYSSPGCKINFGKIIAMADEKELLALGITANTFALYEPFIKLCWIDAGDSAAASNAGIELKEPLDMIFIHLLYQMWFQLKRFCNYDDPEIRSLIEKEEVNTAVDFMRLMNCLLDMKIPVTDKAIFLKHFKENITGEKGIQDMGREIIKFNNFAPVYPLNKPFFTYFKCDPAIEDLVTAAFCKTKNKQWAAQILPADCKDILSAMRRLNYAWGRCIVSGDHIAFALSSIAQLEFPHFEFKTKADLEGENIVVDEHTLETITLR